MIRKILITVLGCGFAWMMAYLFTGTLREEGRIKSRGMSYFLCVVFVFVGSVLWGAMAPGPVYPGDVLESGMIANEYSPGVSSEGRYVIARTTFFVTIIPALIGVRMALGRRT